MYRKFGKRVLDIVLVLIFFALFWWVYIVVGLLVKKKLGSPVIFSQKRPGKDGKIFTMYKFRSMTDGTDKNGKLLSDEVRLPKFGKLLRVSSLDELPGLLNILKGEMSLIGPRPLATIYLPYYTKQENRRHEVRPGLSGLAQVKGRNSLLWEDRFANDIEYVDNITFTGDLKLIFQTVFKVVKKENIIIRGTGKVEDFHTYRMKQNKVETIKN